MKKDIYISLDVETTGTDFLKDKIIEIGIIKFKGEKIIEKFSSFVNPQQKVSSHILAITGINDEELKSAPIFEEIKEKIKEFVDDFPIIGHNIDFDLEFLKKEGLELNNPYYDTWHLSTMILPHLSSHSLSFLTKKLNIEHLEEHRALSDALACFRLFNFLKRQIKKLPSSVLEEIYKIIGKTEWLYKDFFIPGEKIKKDKKKTKLLEETKELPKNIKEEFRKYIQLFDLKKVDITSIKEIFLSLKGGKKIFLETSCPFRTAFFISLYTAIFKNLKILLAIPSIKEGKQEIKKLSKMIFIPSVLPSGRQIFCFLESYQNYICPIRFQHFLQKKKFTEEELRFLVKLLLFFQTIEEGTKSDLALIGEENILFSKVNVPFKDCCKTCIKNDCFYKKALKKAKESNLVITPQSLLVEINQNHFPFLIIFEADLLEDEINFGLGFSVSHKEFIQLLEEIKEIFPKNKKVLELERVGDIFWGVLGILIKKENQKMAKESSFLIFSDRIQTSGDFKKFEKLTIRFLDLLLDLKLEMEDQLKNINSFSTEIEIKFLIKKIEQIVENLKIGILKKNKKNWLFWGEIFGREQILKIKKRLLFVKEISKKLFEKKESILLISPALSTGRNFQFIKSQIGGENFEEKIITSWENDFFLVVLENFSEPESPYYRDSLSQFIEFSIPLNQKTIFVFSRSEILGEIFDKEASFFRKIKIDLIAQQGNRLLEKNIEHFKYTPKSFLFVLPNNVLKFLKQFPSTSLIFLEKLPFKAPSPISEGKSEYLGNEFFEYSKMRAVLQFKKIAEIFRYQTKKGILVLLSKKILEKDYGISFLQSLYNVPVQVLKKEKLNQFLKNKLWKT